MDYTSYTNLDLNSKKILSCICLLPSCKYNIQFLASLLQLEQANIESFSYSLLELSKTGFITIEEYELSIYDESLHAKLLNSQPEHEDMSNKLIESLIWSLRFEYGSPDVIKKIKNFLPIAEHVIEHTKIRSKDFIILVNNVAIGNRILGNYNRCAAYQNMAIKVAEKYNALPERELIDLYINYGEFISHFGDIKDALVTIEKGLTMFEANSDLHSEESKSVTFHNSAIVFLKANKIELALEYEEKAIQALKIMSKLKNHTHPALANAYDILAQILFSIKKFEESSQYSELAISTAKECVGVSSPILAKILNNYANNIFNKPNLNNLKESFSKSLNLREAGIEILESITGLNHPELGQMYLSQGFNYILMNKWEEAYLFYRKAKPYIEKYTEEDSHLRAELFNLELQIGSQQTISAWRKLRMEEEPDWEVELKKFLDRQ
jgi:tetratricopeptide (TPR) repeat protein